MAVRFLTPDRWTPWGEASARLPDGRDAIIWQGIPGERAKVQPSGGGQHKVHGHWLAADHPHPLRREPPCGKVNPCGGCPLMHLVEEGQHRARLAMMRAAFALERVDLRVPETVVASPDGVEDYRHSVKMACGRSPMGSTRLGAFGRGTHDVVPIPGCNVATPLLRQLMNVVAHHTIDLKMWPWDPETGQGALRYVVIRQSRASGKAIVTLVCGRGGRMPRQLAERIQQQHGQVAGVALHINSLPGNAIYDSEPGEAPQFLALTGNPILEEELAGVRLRVGPGDFFQANPGMADQIATDLVELLKPWRDRPVLDLYCGVGGFTLALGRAHGWAFGAEVVPGAIERAKENALLNHIPAEFGVGRVEDILPDLKRRTAGQGPVVMVDPARRGLEEGVIESIAELQPAALAYLSCNPRALARDLRLLLDRGWSVRELRAYDMFPQTAHLETLALLQPPEAPTVTRRAPRRRIIR